MRNDVAILQPPRRGAVILVVLTERDDPAEGHDDALVADLPRAVLSHVS